MDYDAMFDVLGFLFGETEHNILVEAYDGDSVRAAMGRSDVVETHVKRWVERKGCPAAFGAATVKRGSTHAELEYAEVPAIVVCVSVDRLEGMMALDAPPSIVVKGAENAWGVWVLDAPARPEDGTLTAVMEALDARLDEMVPLPGQDSVDVVVFDEDRVYTLQDMAECFCDTLPAESECDTLPAEDDAHGPTYTIPETWTAEVAFGSGADGKPGTWRNKTINLETLVVGLTTHKTGQKDGPAFLQGACVQGTRTAKAMSTISIIGVDVDNGLPSEEIDLIIKEKGLFAVRYTTHSHGKDVIEVSNDNYVKWCEKNPGCGASEYLQAVKHYLPDVAKTAKIGKKVHKKSGLMLQIEHKPIDKNRVIFVLHNPWELLVYSNTQEGINTWKRAYAAFCEWLGLPYDQSCVDPSRLFYLPRHTEGAPYESVVHEGNAVDIFALPPASYVPGVDRGGRPDNVFAQAAHDMGADDSGASPAMKKWAAQYANRFMVIDALEANGEDVWRPEFDNTDKRHMECPFEDEHTEVGGGGFYVENPDTTDSGTFAANCRHNSCVGRDRLDFLSGMIERGWLTAEDLTDDAYLIEVVEEDDGESGSGEETAEGDSTVKEVMEKIKALVGASPSPIEKAAALDALSKAYPSIGKRALQNEYANIEQKIKDKKKLDKDLKSTEEVSDGKLVALPMEQGFDELIDKGWKAIQNRNTPAPFIFQYMGQMVRLVERSKSDKLCIEHMKTTAVSLEVSKASKWLTPTGPNGEMRSQAPDQSVISHMTVEPRPPIPEMVGMAYTPFFAPSGNLVMEKGFNEETGMYLDPGKSLNLPPVSQKPTKEEVARAKELILGNVLVDFPFASPDGTGQASRAMSLSMYLLPFVRPMIDGPTPVHFIEKPVAGTGSGLLTEAFAMIVTGEEGVAKTQKSTEDETQKLILSSLREGLPYFWMDNISKKVDSGTLASAITSSQVGGRVLGESNNEKYPVTWTWIFTGNNTKLSEEMVRRCFPIRLDAKVPNPEERKEFKHKFLMRWVKENRAELVWACLTLVQAWVAAGCPEGAPKAPTGSFEAWAYTMSGIMEVIEVDGFLDELTEMRAKASEDTDEVNTFVQTWYDTFNSLDVRVSVKDEPEDGTPACLLDLIMSGECSLPISVQGTRLSIAKRLGIYLAALDERMFFVDSYGVKTRVVVTRSSRVAGGVRWHLAEK